MMSKKKFILFAIFGILALVAFNFSVSTTQARKKMYTGKQEKRLTQTEETRTALKPAQTLNLLREGNQRFAEEGRTTPSKSKNPQPDAAVARAKV